MQNLHWRWIGLAAVVFLVVWGLSLWAFPSTRSSLADFLTMSGLAAVGAIGTAAAVRALAERKDNTPSGVNASHPMTPGEIKTGDIKDSPSVAIGPNATATTNITNIIQESARPQAARFSLPARPDHFTGRESEVDTVVKRLREGGGSLVSGLAGLGGVGKTAVAIEAAHKVKDDFPDGQIWVEMRGTGDAPVTVNEAMTFVIRAMEPDADLRDVSGTELAGIYRTALNGKRVLLVLDNAKDARQVQGLLVPAPCAVVVTARTAFTLAGLQPLRLDTLKKAEAEKLLGELCPRIGKDTADLAELCGCLPLALRIAGRYLAEHETVPVARYVKQVHERRLQSLVAEGERDLDAVFAETYDHLAEGMKKQWRALGVFPAPYTASAAGAVWGLEDAEGAGDILGELVRMSLVEYDAGSGRFDLHDLLRDFAVSRLGEEEKLEGEKRYAGFYMNVATTAKELYKRGGENVVAGLKLFEQELTHIRAGQAWAARNLERDEDAARLCNEYPNAAAFVARLRFSASEHIRWLEHGASAAKQLGKKEYEGVHLGYIGARYQESGDARKAIDYFERAIEIARQTQDKHNEGVHLGNLGIAYADLGETRRAIEFYEQQLTITREIGDRRGEGNALGNLGNAYAALGETRRAIEYHEQALIIDREIGDRRGEGQDLGNLGIAYKNLGETRRAIEFYERALVIDREIGDRRGEGAALANMGKAYEKLGDLETARAHWQEALNIFEAIEDPNAERVRGWLEGDRRPAASG